MSDPPSFAVFVFAWLTIAAAFVGWVVLASWGII
jgi:hypothetical protein